jgi:putative selenate reductase molybdopterin-binding subunit
VPGAPVIHDEPEARVVIPITYDPKTNLAGQVRIDVGDLQRGLAEADVVVEREFKAHYAQHCPIEPHITLAMFDEDGRLVLVTSTQVPFHARRIVAQALQIPLKNVRIIKPRIGGGFGSKQEVFLEQVCAALALAAKRPVKIRYTREDDIARGRTRHEMYVTITLGAKRDGTLTAIGMNVLSNTGAYGAHALTVASNCGSKVLPLYPCDNVLFDATIVYTNMPVGGAYRGYGATQAAFAMECALDELAHTLGIDPVAYRQQLHIRSGQTSPIFAKLGEGKAGVQQSIGSCGLPECITQGAAAIAWQRKFKPYTAHRSDSSDQSARTPVRRGVGMCTLMQGSSIPEIDMGAASIKMNEDGSFNLLVGATDLGTGSDTILAQIAADVLGVEANDMLVYSSDTDMTPFDVGAYASSTTYLSGNAVIKTAEAVKTQLLRVAAAMTGRTAAGAVLRDKQVVFADGARVPFADIACYALYQKDQFQIAATESYISHVSPPPFAAHFAEVAVDIETGEVQLLKYVAAVDCGAEINPQLARGQTEGAVVNGIGYALCEEFIFDRHGRLLTDSFMNYKIPSTRDLPELVTIHVPSHEATGPFGAKSVSEISINGALPAIANAIFNATGARLTEGPFTPERVLRAIRAAR